MACEICNACEHAEHAERCRARVQVLGDQSDRQAYLDGTTECGCNEIGDGSE